MTRLEIAAMMLVAWHRHEDAEPKLKYAPEYALKWADALIAEDQKTSHVEAGVETQNIRVMITAAEYRLIRRTKDVDKATAFLEANGFLRPEVAG